MQNTLRWVFFRGGGWWLPQNTHYCLPTIELPTKKVLYFRGKYLEPLISIKKGLILKRNIFIPVFQGSQISRLYTVYWGFSLRDLRWILFFLYKMKMASKNTYLLYPSYDYKKIWQIVFVLVDGQLEKVLSDFKFFWCNAIFKQKHCSDIF